MLTAGYKGLFSGFFINKVNVVVVVVVSHLHFTVICTTLSPDQKSGIMIPPPIFTAFLHLSNGFFSLPSQTIKNVANVLNLAGAIRRENLIKDCQVGMPLQ